MAARAQGTGGEWWCLRDWGLLVWSDCLGGSAIVIRVGVVGLIRYGDDAGKYVRVQELPDATPSYLVLMARDQEFTSGDGDCWVEDHAALEEFFAESRWVVEWLRK